GPQSDLLFSTNRATATAVTNNIVDSSTTVASIQFVNSNNTFHTTFIPSNTVLTISKTGTGNALLAGGIDAGTNQTSSVNAVISGSNGLLVVSAPNAYLSASQGGNSAGNAVGAQRATLDLS